MAEKVWFNPREYYGLNWRQWKAKKARKHFLQHGKCTVCEKDVDFDGCHGHHDNRDSTDHHDTNLFIVHGECHTWVHSRNIKVVELVKWRKNGQGHIKTKFVASVGVKSLQDANSGFLMETQFI